MASTKIINILRTDKIDDILGLFKETTASEVIFVLPKKTRVFNSSSHFEKLSEVAKEFDKNASFLCQDPETENLASHYGFATLVAAGRPDNRGRKRINQPIKIEKQNSDPIAQLAIKRDDYTGEVVDEESENDEHEADEHGYRIEDVDKEDSHGVLEDDTDIAQDEEDHELNDSDLESEEKNLDLDEDETKEDEFADITLNNSNTAQDFEIITAAKINRSLSDIVRPGSDKPTSLKIARRSEPSEPVPVQKENGPGSLNQRALDEIKNVWQGTSGLWSQKNDILPRKKKQTESPLKFLIPESGFSFKQNQRGGTDSSVKKALVGLIVVALVVFGSAVYLTAGSAKVIIEPKKSPVEFSLKLVAADSYDSADIKTARLPGQTFTINRQGQETRPATGERDVAQKSRGKIIIYNEYGTTSQVLIATTRFESESGLIFRTLTTVTVPGTRVENGQITAGKVEVEVIADKPGDTYNIGPGRFKISAFREKGDLDRYQKFYGLSTETMRGGVVGKAKVVTESDYNSARQALEDKLKSEARQAIESQSSGLRIVYTSNPEIADFQASARIDEAADEISLSGRATVIAVGIKDDDLFKLLNQYLSQIGNWNSGPDFINISLSNPTYNNTTKVAEFVVNVTGDAFALISTEDVRQDLIGMTKDEVSAYFKADPRISSAHVILSPFWVRQVPENPEKLSVELLLKPD